MSEGRQIYDELGVLIDGWCQRRDLRSLAIVLPASQANNGLTDGWGNLLEALRSLRARRILPPDEQDAVERLVVRIERVVYRT